VASSTGRWMPTVVKALLAGVVAGPSGGRHS
jgi:hypothetical protein